MLSAVVSVTDEELEQIQDWVRFFWEPDEISDWQLITDTFLFGVAFLLVCFDFGVFCLFVCFVLCFCVFCVVVGGGFLFCFVCWFFLFICLFLFFLPGCTDRQFHVGQ